MLNILFFIILIVAPLISILPIISKIYKIYREGNIANENSIATETEIETKKEKEKETTSSHSGRLRFAQNIRSNLQTDPIAVYRRRISNYIAVDRFKSPRVKTNTNITFSYNQIKTANNKNNEITPKEVQKIRSKDSKKIIPEFNYTKFDNMNNERSESITARTNSVKKGVNKKNLSVHPYSENNQISKKNTFRNKKKP